MLTCNRNCSLSVIQQIIQLLFRLKSQWDGQGFEHRAVVSESSLSRELSAGEVVGPAFDEQIKRSAGTLAFTLPFSSLWIRKGLFRWCLFVCLFLTNKSRSLQARSSVWWGNESPRGCIIPSNILLPLSAWFVCFIFVWLYNSTKPSSSVQQENLASVTLFINLSTLPPACHLSPRESRTLSQLSDMTENFWT